MNLKYVDNLFVDMHAGGVFSKLGSYFHQHSVIDV